MFEVNFIRNDTKEDRDLFFGPLEPEDKFVKIEDFWTMAHIMNNIGLFPSVTQARKNGWDKPIPKGFNIFEVGKREKKRVLYILN